MAQNHVFDDLEARCLPDRPSDGAPDPAHVDPALVPRQFRVETPDVDRKVLAQHLQQSGVETRLVVVGGHPDPAADGFPLDADGKQDQGRPEMATILFVPPPKEKAEGEVKRIRAALLQGGLGSAVDLDGALGKLLRGEVDEHAGRPVLKRLPRVFLSDDLAGPLPVYLLILTPYGGFGNRPDPDPGAFGELVLEQPRIRTEDPKAGGRRTVIEERISDREIE